MCKKSLSWLLVIAMFFSMFTAIPITASALPTVTVPVAGGYRNGYTVKSDGTVWAWGYNGRGQLGNGNTTDSKIPVQVTGLTGVTAVAAGNEAGYALESNGTVWAWGYNGQGQLGNGNTTDSNIPVQVTGLTGITAIASRQWSGYALKSDGTVWAWGYSSQGQLGNNSATNSNVPVQVGTLTGATAIACGDYSGCAVVGGEVWSWGSNQYGQLGNGTTATSLVPVKVSGLTNITAVAAGFYTAYALKSDGTVWAWGLNDQGQLGIGTYFNGDYRNVPVQVTGLTDIEAVAAEGYGGYALDSSGNVWSWGDTGNTSSRNLTPVNVADPSNSSGYLSHVTAIAGGFYNAFVLKSDGSVWSWGSNSYGSLGNNSNSDSLVPVQVYGFDPLAEAVCEIGSTQYAALGAALSAVSNGQTIKLLQSISYTGGITATDKSFTIDLNTYTLNINSSAAHGIDAENGKAITFSGVGGLNVTVTNPSGSYFGLYANGAGSAIISGPTVVCTVNDNGADARGISAYSGGTVALTGSVTTTGTNGVGVLADGAGSTVTVNGMVNSAYLGAYVQSSGSISVTGNVTSSGTYGAYTFHSGTITVGGSLSGADYGADAYNGGTITVTGDVTATGASGTGAYGYEGGIIDVSCSVSGGRYGAAAYGSGSSITIGGNSTADCGLGPDTYGSAAQAGDDSSITIHGSTFVTGSYGYGTNASNGGTVTIEGNISAPGTGCYGASAAGTSAASSVTVDGTIAAETYVRIAGVSKTAADMTLPTTLAGYLAYTDGATPSNTVWVKEPSANGFVEDFESDPGSCWTVTGSASASWSFTDPITSPATAAHSGTHVAIFNSSSAITGDNAYLSYKNTLDLSDGGRYGLEFWMYHDSEDSTATDTLKTQVSVDGGTNWADIGTYYRYSETEGWIRNHIDLSAEIQSVTDKSNVCIRFSGTSAAGNNIFIDDVSVFSLCIVDDCPGSLADGGFAEYTEIGSERYYHVSTAAQLAHINEHLDLNYIQTADIDLSQYNDGLWTPIGGFGDPDDYSNPRRFTGKYLGNGYKIENLNIYFNDTERNAAYAGVFAYIYGIDAGVSGLAVTVIGADITACDYSFFGAVAGAVYGGSITDCHAVYIGDVDAAYAEGEVRHGTPNGYIGGITGSAYPQWDSEAGGYFPAVIDGCSVTFITGSILAAGWSKWAGGIVGSGETAITNCNVIIGEDEMIQSPNAGGIVGLMYAKTGGTAIGNCTVAGAGSIVASPQHAYSYYVGGIAGRFAEGCITDSSNEVFVNTTGVTEINVGEQVYAGGLVGYLGSRSVVTGCRNTGDVSVVISNNIFDDYGATGTSTYDEFAFAGGVAGYVYGYSNAVTIENCENNADISAVNLNMGLRAYAGGIAGHIDSWDGDSAGVTVKNCANLGADKTIYTSAGTTMTGGLFGSTSFHDFTTPNIILQNCYNVSSVMSESNSAPATNGMCVGITAGGIIGAVGEVTVENTYSTASYVSAISTNGADAYEGGLFGVLYMTTASLNYYEENNEITRAVGAAGELLQAPDDHPGSYESASASELKTKSFLAGWPWYTGGGITPDYYSSSQPWRFTDDNSYPVLKGLPITTPTPPSGSGSYFPSTYQISAIANEGGIITPAGNSILAEYSNIKFIIKPDENSVIENVMVDGTSVGAVTEYTFSSVGADHTIEAVFTHDCPSKPFFDVDITQWYHEGIDYVLLASLFKGTSATTFEPNAAMTRAMLVTALWRLDNEPDSTAANLFADVAEGTWYMKAVAWAAKNDIVEGYDADSFGPNDPITREQMAAILYRYTNYKGYDLMASNDLTAFADAGDVSEWALTAVKWAVAEGLIIGTTSTWLNPVGNSSRAQVATILMRFEKNIIG